MEVAEVTVDVDGAGKGVTAFPIRAGGMVEEQAGSYGGCKPAVEESSCRGGADLAVVVVAVVLVALEHHAGGAGRGVDRDLPVGDPEHYGISGQLPLIGGQPGVIQRNRRMPGVFQIRIARNV